MDKKITFLNKKSIIVKAETIEVVLGGIGFSVFMVCAFIGIIIFGG